MKAAVRLFVNGLNGFWFKLMFAAFVAAGAAVCIGCAQTEQQLVLRNSASGKVCGSWPLEAGGEFSIEFVHSVHNSPVRETFRAADGRIGIVSVRFFAFGAGMLGDLAEGQTLSRDGDALVISGFAHPPRTELRYIVGTVSDHVLLINGESVSLRDLCGRNAAVTIGIAKKRWRK